MKQPSKKVLRSDKYDRQQLKERIDVAMAAFLSSGNTVQRWQPELLYPAAQLPPDETA